ncbi:MAG: enoyl-CoA hydratase [Moraxellaceae bacterium]|jgi:2-(1,2-epoxy-1,2-dihydrophenyl)acetyl-CoA isomerase|nr:enoyl-CoA hydratase [Moraxellaceae bacterium]
MTAPVLLHREDGLAILTLNRPGQLNTLDLAMAQALHEAFAGLAADDSVRAVLLRAEGKYFCAGGHVAEFGSLLQREVAEGRDYFTRLIHHVHATVALIAGLRAPVVACVQGGASGAGLSLVAACDFAFASEKSAWNTAYMSLGTTPDGGSTWLLPRLMGLRQARELILLAERFGGEEALRLGLVNRLLPTEALETEARALAQRLSRGPTAAYGRAKKLLADSLQASLPTQLQAEEESFLASSATADFVEGVSAFLEKRPAVFSGR